MTRLLTAAQMRAAERAAMDAGDVSGRELMERAARGVARTISERWPDLRPARAAVLCGPGNNGGDGFAIARLLSERGWRVALWLWGDGDGLPPDAAANRDAWAEIGTVRPWNADDIAGCGADLVVDAVFGAGLTRPPPAETVAPFRAMSGRIVAVDAPTGLCMDSGRPLSDEIGAVRAKLTVTFQAPRPGHFLADGPAHCGRLVCVDIGLPPTTGGVPLVTGPTGDLAKPAGAHKYDSGHVLVLGGGPAKGGAARMTARGALRVGAGLVTVGCTPAALPENAAQLNAIMLRPVRDSADLAQVLDDPRINCVALGPGLGGGARTRESVRVVLRSKAAAVLDADALTAFQDNPAELHDALREDCLLTPHAGEFARVFPAIADRLKAPPASGPAMSRLDATREAAAQAGCIVLLKGPDTIIAAPDGRAAIHAASYDRAVPWLATAGAGDVLGGIAAGLMARGFPAFDAAATAAWLHAEAARRFGPGLIAEDIPEGLPAVLRDLGV